MHAEHHNSKVRESVRKKSEAKIQVAVEAEVLLKFTIFHTSKKIISYVELIMHVLLISDVNVYMYINRIALIMTHTCTHRGPHKRNTANAKING